MFIRKSLAVLGILGALIGQTYAADLLVEAPPEEPEIVSTSGWYLRGDIGYVFGSKVTGDWDVYNPLPGAEGVDDTLRIDLFETDGAASFGIGAGYRFNEVFRMDATLDYFKTSGNTKTRCWFNNRADPEHGIPRPVDGDCNLYSSGSAEIWSPMLNAYADLPKVGGLTPYIGVGIGAALVDYSDVKVIEKCGDCTNPDFRPINTTDEGFGEWRIAGSAMVGAAYDLTDNTLLDFGYKYTRIGGGDISGFGDVERAAGAKGAQARDNGFDFHALRVGVRYEFN